MRRLFRRLTRRWQRLLLALIAFPALAQEQPLSGDAFEAFVEGRTMDTYDETGRFGVETFLPGRRTIWRDGERCRHGNWSETDGVICYTYEGDPGPYCSNFLDRGGWLIGFKDGIWGQDPILLYPSSETVSCEDFFGT